MVKEQVVIVVVVNITPSSIMAATFAFVTNMASKVKLNKDVTKMSTVA